MHILIEQVAKENPDVICLQETWLRSFNLTKLTKHFNSYKWFLKTADSYLQPEELINTKNLSHHGTAMAIKLEISDSATEVPNSDSNLLAVTLEMKGAEILLLCLYLPSSGREFEDFVTSTAVLADVVDETGRDIVIAIGDVNVSRKHAKRRQSCWNEFLAKAAIKDNIRGKVTHVHKATGSRDELDRVLTRNSELEKLWVVEDVTNRSEHRPIIAEVKFQTTERIGGQEEREEEMMAQTKIRLDLLDMEEYRNLTNDLAMSLREEFEGNSYSRDDENAIISNMIWRTALSLTGQQPEQARKKKKRKILRIQPRIYQEAIRAHRAYKDKGLVRGSREHRIYKAARKRLQECIKYRTRKEEEALQMEIINTQKSKKHKIFGVLKKVKHGREAPDTMPTKLTGYGKVYLEPNVMKGFRDLYEIQGLMDHEGRYREDRLDLAKEFIAVRKTIEWTEEEDERIELTWEKYTKFVGELSSGKAQDSQGLSNDLLKHCGHEMHKLIFEHLRGVMKEDNFGGLKRNYGKGAVIVKKQEKSKTVIGNYRKIVSNNVLSNLVQYVLQSSIEEKIQKVQTEAQMGFTPGIPVMHAVVAREEILSLSRKMDKTVYLAVLDLKSCFPRIPREQLLQLLAPHATVQEWNLVEQIYSGTWSDVRIQGRKSRPFRQNIGTIEGGVLSPTLLKLFLSVLLKLLRRAGFDANVNFLTGELRAGAIGIADDVVLFAWNPDTLRTMLAICEEWSNRYRAMFSPEKSVILIQPARNDFTVHNSFNMYGQPLMIVNEAEHLGTPTVPRGNGPEITRDRTKAFRRAVHGSISFYGSRSLITQAMKLQLWERVFKPTLQFSTETALMPKRSISDLEKSQMHLLRGAFRLSKRSSKSRIRLLTGTPTLESEILKQRLTTLNGVMTRRTMPRRYCLLNILIRNSGSWAYRTACDLGNLIQDRDPMSLLDEDKNTFKTGIKGAIMGREIALLESQRKSESVFDVLPDVFQRRNPLIDCDFQWAVQSDLDSWMRVMTGDYLRATNRERGCLVCGKEEDDVTHFLGDKCEVERSPEAGMVWAQIVLTLQTCFPNHTLANVQDITLRAKFIINPTSIFLGRDRLSPDEIQGSGLDNLIRRWAAQRLKYRNKLLKNKGLLYIRKSKNPDAKSKEKGKVKKRPQNSKKLC